MNKQLLAAMFRQVAPQILPALKGAHMMPGDTDAVELALQNGADPGLMGDQFNEIAARRKALNDGRDTPMSDTMNIYELNKLYDTTAQKFPSMEGNALDFIEDLRSNVNEENLMPVDKGQLDTLDSLLENPQVRAAGANMPIQTMVDTFTTPLNSKADPSERLASGLDMDPLGQLGKRKLKYPATMSALSMNGGFTRQHIDDIDVELDGLYDYLKNNH